MVQRLQRVLQETGMWLLDHRRVLRCRNINLQVRQIADSADTIIYDELD